MRHLEDAPCSLSLGRLRGRVLLEAISQVFCLRAGGAGSCQPFISLFLTVWWFVFLLGVRFYPQCQMSLDFDSGEKDVCYFDFPFVSVAVLEKNSTWDF